MQGDKEAVLARTDLVALVGQRVRLERAGKNYKGLCPFHEDHNPSFVVMPERGRYKCWACNASGDAFTWVMQTQNVEFRQALEILAEAAGIQLAHASPISGDLRRLRAEILDVALAFFRDRLARSPEARAYLKARGIDEATTKKWELGYAPSGSQLTAELRRKKLDLEVAHDLYVVRRGENGIFDAFRDRLMFPIRDETGRLVAFGGRVLGNQQPKYINSGETPLYSKRKLLYGLYAAREAFRNEGKAVVVEGYLDAIACSRAGIGTAVASLGTALTSEQAALLKRWVGRAVVLYDSDEAGRKATVEAIEILDTAGLDVRVALLPVGHDPDSLLTKEGSEALISVVESAVKPCEFHLRRLRASSSPHEPEFWSRAVEHLARASRIEAEVFLPELAAEYPGVRDVSAAMAAIRKMVEEKRNPSPVRRATTGVKPSPASLRETVVLAALFVPDLAQAAWDACSQPELFISPEGFEIAQALSSTFPTEAPSGAPAAWLSRIEPEEVRQRLCDIVDSLSFEVQAEVFEEAIGHLQQAKKKRQLEGLRDNPDDLEAIQKAIMERALQKKRRSRPGI